MSSSSCTVAWNPAAVSLSPTSSKVSAPPPAAPHPSTCTSAPPDVGCLDPDNRRPPRINPPGVPARFVHRSAPVPTPEFGAPPMRQFPEAVVPTIGKDPGHPTRSKGPIPWRPATRDATQNPTSRSKTPSTSTTGRPAIWRAASSAWPRRARPRRPPPLRSCRSRNTSTPVRRFPSTAPVRTCATAPPRADGGISGTGGPRLTGAAARRWPAAGTRIHCGKGDGRLPVERGARRDHRPDRRGVAVDDATTLVEIEAIKQLKARYCRLLARLRPLRGDLRERRRRLADQEFDADTAARGYFQIGRASCRERGWVQVG